MPPPRLVLYTRAGCHLCDDARSVLAALLAQRARSGRPTPVVEERDIDTNPDWLAANSTAIPVIELGERRLEVATSAAKVRQLLADALDGVAVAAEHD